MPIKHLLIANRGEIAIRITRAASELGISTTAIYAEDDKRSLHVQFADHSQALTGSGASAYQNIDQIIEIATRNDCDAIHPGYGFLAENVEFATQCRQAGLVFVGPETENLALFGNKTRAREVAKSADVPVIHGTDTVTSLAQAKAFFQQLDGGAMIIKAIAGGGGRGSRTVFEEAEITNAYERCQSEATSSFGNGDLYVEQLLLNVRHIEVQILGDFTGRIIHLGERDCSVQRRHQKIVEIAPAPNLDESLRQQLNEAAVRLAKHTHYCNLGTFEFLVDVTTGDYAFIEANARLQVEHTVTEEVTGVDLVQVQLQLAAGKTLAELGLEESIQPRGYAIQARVNMETIAIDGTVLPGGGTLSVYNPPSGPRVRTDGFGYTNYTTSPHYDSLLAKVICFSPTSLFEQASQRTYRALSEFQIEGVQTNLQFLQNVLRHPDFTSANISTRWVDQNISQLAEIVPHRRLYQDQGETQATGLAGAQIDNTDPLALFAHDRAVKSNQSAPAINVVDTLVGPQGSIGIPAPIQGTIVAVQVNEGDEVHSGQLLAVMEAMKMEHEIRADRNGIIRKVSIKQGTVIAEGHPMVFIEAAEVATTVQAEVEELDLDYIRPDLAESYRLHAYSLDENRPKAVARREKTHQRTARANMEDLCDEGTFIEYGPLVLAAQRRRRTEEWLRENTPGDGMICGVGSVNGDLFDKDIDSRCVALSYDYTVLAGTQGIKNHYKQDRMFELANRFKLPLILFSEGGGGRPGDTDGAGGIGMDVYTFTQFSKLSALVPMVGINSGRCFAGNTALLGCCDVIIATENSTIAMGGPAMIEGGGLGIFTPEEIGPMATQVPNGVVDILVADEAEAVQVAKKYIAYFQGRLAIWESDDQRRMRHIVPENRKRMYDVREVINLLSDTDSVLEIRTSYGIGIITAFVRVEGHALGLIANNPHHLAGAIDSDAADKAARFLQLCDAFDLPIISLMDCPGIMVGPEVEKTALVRHCCRLFNTGANLSVPMFGIILRKAYGLGVQAMCGGSSMVPFFTVAWPTAEFAGMNIEGSVKLGFRNELEAIDDPEERLARYTKMVEASYERAKAINSAPFFGVDDIIDPTDTRSWIVRGLKSLPPKTPRTGKKRPYIDTW